MTGAAPKPLNLQFNPPRTIFVPKVAVLNDPTTGGAKPASEPSWTLLEPLQHLRRLLGSKTRPVEAAQTRPLTLISFRLSNGPVFSYCFGHECIQDRPTGDFGDCAEMCGRHRDRDYGPQRRGPHAGRRFVGPRL